MALFSVNHKYYIFHQNICHINRFTHKKLHKKYLQKRTMKAYHPKQIFKGYEFLMLSNNLTEREIAITQRQIKEAQGEVETLQFPLDQTKNLKKKRDYLLASQQLDPKMIMELLGDKVIFKQILDINYIHNCIKAERILNTNKFRLGDGFMQMEQQEQSHSQPRKLVKKDQQTQKKKVDITKNKFDKPNNTFIIEELNKLYKVYANQGDKGRKIAYSRAIVAIKALQNDIQTDEDIDALKKARHIGDKISAKIKQLLKTGHIRKLESLKNTDKNLGLEQLTRVWGIGSAKAKQLYQKGIKTIQQLRNCVQASPDILTKNQKIGLRYLQDLQLRIPRNKVTLMFEYVREVFYELVGDKNLHEIQVCGSYRRQKPSCGDIDIFITRKDGTYQADLLTKLVKKLEQKGFLTDHLTMPRHLTSHSCQSYMGICQFKSQVHHHIDIKYYPSNQFAFAVLYFTGSEGFNRKMRLWALQNGYQLSDHGLNKIDKVGTVVTPIGAPIKCKTQKQIFQVLGIEYKHPRDREV